MDKNNKGRLHFCLAQRWSLEQIKDVTHGANLLITAILDTEWKKQGFCHVLPKRTCMHMLACLSFALPLKSPVCSHIIYLLAVGIREGGRFCPATRLTQHLSENHSS